MTVVNCLCKLQNDRLPKKLNLFIDRRCTISVRILISVQVSVQFGRINFNLSSVSVLKIISVIVMLIVNEFQYLQFDFKLPLTNISLGYRVWVKCLEVMGKAIILIYF